MRGQVLQAAAVTYPDAQTACMPCCQPTEVVCVGGHEKQEVACKDAAPYSCRRMCGATLACTNCTCSRPCHARETGVPVSLIDRTVDDVLFACTWQLLTLMMGEFNLGHERAGSHAPLQGDNFDIQLACC